MFASDLAMMIADLPASVVIGPNAACNAIVTELQDSDALEMAGVDDTLSISVHVPVASLATPPAPGQRVTVDGAASYRVAMVRKSSDNIEYILDCEAR
jgi:hypothetical protein